MWGITGRSVLTAAVGIVGIFLTWHLARRKTRAERETKAAGYFRGIDAEIDYAIDHAREYVEGGNGERVLSPAYRLPTTFASEGAKWLQTEGFLRRQDGADLLAQLAAAEEFNRCLDEVAEHGNERRGAVANRGTDAAAVEYQTTEFLRRHPAVNRAEVKALNICTGNPPHGTAITARTAIRIAAERSGLSLTD